MRLLEVEITFSFNQNIDIDSPFNGYNALTMEGQGRTAEVSTMLISGAERRGGRD